MNGAVKVGLQIAFLVGLVYVLAGVFGKVESAMGRGWQRKRCGDGQRPGPVLSGAYKYANTGMVSTLMASAGTDVPRVGIVSRIP